MSIKNVEKFLDLVKSNENLQKELILINEKLQKEERNEEKIIADNIVPLAKKNGIFFTADDFLKYADEQMSALSEEDLLNVSGGRSAQNTAAVLLVAFLGSLGAGAAVNLLNLPQEDNKSVVRKAEKNNGEDSRNNQDEVNSAAQNAIDKMSKSDQKTDVDEENNNENEAQPGANVDQNANEASKTNEAEQKNRRDVIQNKNVVLPNSNAKNTPAAPQINVAPHVNAAKPTAKNNIATPQAKDNAPTAAPGKVEKAKHAKNVGGYGSAVAGSEENTAKPTNSQEKRVTFAPEVEKETTTKKEQKKAKKGAAVKPASKMIDKPAAKKDEAVKPVVAATNEDTSKKAISQPEESKETAKILYSGECGENAKWSFDEDGTFTVSGTGPLQEYAHNEEPFPDEIKYSVKRIVIEDGITSLKNFFVFPFVASIDIPASLTELSADYFKVCHKLKSINIDENNTEYKSIDGVLFSKDGTKLLCYPGEKTDPSYTIPTGVTSIADGAFFVARCLDNLIIPSSVSKVGENAFNSSSIKSIVYLGNNESNFGEHAFTGQDNSTTIFVSNDYKNETFGGVAVTKVADLDAKLAELSNTGAVEAAEHAENVSGRIIDYASRHFWNRTVTSQVEHLVNFLRSLPRTEDGMPDLNYVSETTRAQLEADIIDVGSQVYTDTDGSLYLSGKYFIKDWTTVSQPNLRMLRDLYNHFSATKHLVDFLRSLPRTEDGMPDLNYASETTRAQLEADIIDVGSQVYTDTDGSLYLSGKYFIKDWTTVSQPNLRMLGDLYNRFSATNQNENVNTNERDASDAQTENNLEAFKQVLKKIKAKSGNQKYERFDFESGGYLREELIEHILNALDNFENLDAESQRGLMLDTAVLLQGTINKSKGVYEDYSLYYDYEDDIEELNEEIDELDDKYYKLRRRYSEIPEDKKEKRAKAEDECKQILAKKSKKTNEKDQKQKELERLKGLVNFYFEKVEPYYGNIVKPTNDFEELVALNKVEFEKLEDFLGRLAPYINKFDSLDPESKAVLLGYIDNFFYKYSDFVYNKETKTEEIRLRADYSEKTKAIVEKMRKIGDDNIFNQGKEFGNQKFSWAEWGKAAGAAIVFAGAVAAYSIVVNLPTWVDYFFPAQPKKVYDPRQEITTEDKLLADAETILINAKNKVTSTATEIAQKLKTSYENWRDGSPYAEKWQDDWSPDNYIRRVKTNGDEIVKQEFVTPAENSKPVANEGPSYLETLKEGAKKLWNWDIIGEPTENANQADLEGINITPAITPAPNPTPVPPAFVENNANTYTNKGGWFSSKWNDFKNIFKRGGAPKASEVTQSLQQVDYTVKGAKKVDSAAAEMLQNPHIDLGGKSLRDTNNPVVDNPTLPPRLTKSMDERSVEALKPHGGVAEQQSEAVKEYTRRQISDNKREPWSYSMKNNAQGENIPGDEVITKDSTIPRLDAHPERSSGQGAIQLPNALESTEIMQPSTFAVKAGSGNNGAIQINNATTNLRDNGGTAEKITPQVGLSKAEVPKSRESKNFETYSSATQGTLNKANAKTIPQPGKSTSTEVAVLNSEVPKSTAVALPNSDSYKAREDSNGSNLKIDSDYYNPPNVPVKNNRTLSAAEEKSANKFERDLMKFGRNLEAPGTNSTKVKKATNTLSKAASKPQPGPSPTPLVQGSNEGEGTATKSRWSAVKDWISTKYRNSLVGELTNKELYEKRGAERRNRLGKPKDINIERLDNKLPENVVKTENLNNQPEVPKSRESKNFETYSSATQGTLNKANAKTISQPGKATSTAVANVNIPDSPANIEKLAKSTALANVNIPDSPTNIEKLAKNTALVNPDSKSPVENKIDISVTSTNMPQSTANKGFKSYSPQTKENLNRANAETITQLGKSTSTEVAVLNSEVPKSTAVALPNSDSYKAREDSNGSSLKIDSNYYNPPNVPVKNNRTLSAAGEESGNRFEKDLIKFGEDLKAPGTNSTKVKKVTSTSSKAAPKAQPGPRPTSLAQGSNEVEGGAGTKSRLKNIADATGNWVSSKYDKAKTAVKDGANYVSDHPNVAKVAKGTYMLAGAAAAGAVAGKAGTAAVRGVKSLLANPHGNCGCFGEEANVTWEFDKKTGTLTISGNGKMAGFVADDPPWEEYKNKIKVVEIKAGVKSIGDHAFKDCVNLTTVTISEGSALKFIAQNAFYNCKSLNSINIPSGVELIGVNAFYNCISLKSITIPNTLTDICRNAFYGCSGLTHINIPTSVTEIDAFAFAGCTGLVSASIPVGTNNMGKNVFKDCTNLSLVVYSGANDFANIMVGAGGVGIGEPTNVFESCGKLKEIVVLDGTYNNPTFCNIAVKKVDANKIKDLQNQVALGLSNMTVDEAEDLVKGLKRIDFDNANLNFVEGNDTKVDIHDRDGKVKTTTTYGELYKALKKVYTLYKNTIENSDENTKLLFLGEDGKLVELQGTLSIKKKPNTTLDNKAKDILLIKAAKKVFQYIID